MRLVENWRLLLRRAWSVRLMLLAGALSGVEVVLPLVCADVLPSGVFVGLSFAATACAMVARLVAQNGGHRDEQ